MHCSITIDIKSHRGETGASKKMGRAVRVAGRSEATSRLGRFRQLDVECFRQTDSSWAFLVETEEATHGSHYLLSGCEEEIHMRAGDVHGLQVG